MADDDILKEFLLENEEILGELDRQLVALEKNPRDEKCLSAIFRGLHTIKGTSGFLAFEKLQLVAHAGENLLGCLRDGTIVLNSEMTSSLLAMVDVIRAILARIEETGVEGERDDSALIEVLNRHAAGEIVAATVPSSVAAPVPSAPVVTAPVAPAAPAPVVSISPAPPPVVTAAPPPPPVQAAAPVPPAPAVASPAVVAGVPGPAAEPESEHARASASDSTVRVDVGLLDRVMNLVGELVLARNQIIQYGTTVKDAGFADASQRLNLLTTELHERVMKTRMQPIGNVWNKFPRVVRDLAVICGKKVNLTLEGSETELDRTIIEAIKDPLTHAVRNALDHGLETPEARKAIGKSEVGRLLLRAYHEGGQVNVEVSDDGGGLDLERIRARAIEKGLITVERAGRMSDRELMHLIFQPGFSTAAKVTNVSGRGVGMDVVKTNIEKIGGMVDLTSVRHQGTTLKIKLPLTLAIVPALIVSSRGERFAIPQVNLLELVRVEGDGTGVFEQLMGTTVYRLRGNLLPLVFLDEVLGLPSTDAARESCNVVVLQADDRQFGLVVDTVNDTEEIVVKPLGNLLKGLNTFAGATIMGDGRVALILDVLGIAERSNLVSAGRGGSFQDRTEQAEEAGQDRETVVVFRVGQSSRVAMPLSLVSRLEEIPQDRVERAAGRPVVQYRGDLLPLVDLCSELRATPGEAESGPLPVIVYTRQGRSVGLVVSEIIDIVEEQLAIRRTVTVPGVRGTAVLQGKVTDLLDVEAVLDGAMAGFFSTAEAA